MRGKLTPDAKAAIKALRNEGATYQSLANTYGVSKTAVVYICNEQSKAKNEEYKKELEEVIVNDKNAQIRKRIFVHFND